MQSRGIPFEMKIAIHMTSKKNKKQKLRLHPRNKNTGQYDLNALSCTIPALEKYISINKYGNQSIDFSNPIAVKLLNKALKQSKYNQKQAAELLGLTYNQLRGMVRKYAIVGQANDK